MTQFVLANQTPQDEVGRTLPKSRLYFYENNTFNFKDVYSDTARTSVLPNPVIADGDGRFPAIYLATNTNYRVSLKDRFDKQATPFLDNQGTNAQGLGTAAYANKVGLVGNGAIIETETNVNGTFTKFIDGTLICRKKSQTVLSSATGIISEFDEIWAASFIDTDYTISFMQSTAHGDPLASSAVIGQSISGKGTQFCFFAGSSRFNSAIPYQFDLTAIGRWF